MYQASRGGQTARGRCARDRGRRQAQPIMQLREAARAKSGLARRQSTPRGAAPMQAQQYIIRPPFRLRTPGARSVPSRLERFKRPRERFGAVPGVRDFCKPPSRGAALRSRHAQHLLGLHGRRLRSRGLASCRKRATPAKPSPGYPCAPSVSCLAGMVDCMDWDMAAEEGRLPPARVRLPQEREPI